ncbi:MAG: lipoprotein-releasing ABC transporter permease subunit [Proteobacteria bacterium]|nr:lipoprotein-releasing ABC transporter permease subunit [Pseudomonadota bacterium]MBU1716951.1 lipoprotein-releasing ABC transporter permease subunit [Pseudomonadota bacterium]
MHFEWFVCLRYLKAKRKQGFISLITFISVAGVAVGVMALICVLGVMTGFTDGFRTKILGINSHIVVQKLGDTISNYAELQPKIMQIEGVAAVTPYLYTQTMISGHSGGTGAIMRGIDPGSVTSVLSIEQHMQQGSIEDLALPADDPEQPRVPGVIIGSELAKQLRLRKNDRIRLISAAGPLTPMGVIPKMKACRVAGVFETGMYEYDSTLIYVSLETAQGFLDIGDSVHGLEVKVKDIYQAGVISEQIEQKLGMVYIAKDWMKMNKNLFSALQLEKTALSIIVALIVLVAAFNIVSTLTMVVMEKNKDIAILKSMGATARNIMRIFIYEGLVIGLAGTILGIIGGLTLCELLSHYQFIKLPDVYPLSILPVKVLPLDVIMISVSAVLITFLATLYPSWQASRVEPAVALRYEH